MRIVPPAARDLIDRMDLVESDVTHVLLAEAASDAALSKARRLLDVIADGGGSLIAVGSLGRRELSDCSDLDCLYVHDGSAVADEACTARIACLREHGFTVFTKTFGVPVDINALLENIGGENDTPLLLTYRALLLTEATWLDSPERAVDHLERLLGKYRSALTRGRFMSLLLNELNRYYRTLLVDYRFKIEDDGKSFGDRNMKLRHSRKVWYLANLALHCTAPVAAEGDLEVLDAHVAERLGWPPLLKLTDALSVLGEEAACREVWLAHDHFLGRMSKRSVREALESVRPDDASPHAAFQDLKQNADRLQDGCASVIAAMSRSKDCQKMLVKYGLL